MNEPTILVYDPAKYGPDARVEVWGTPPGHHDEPSIMLVSKGVGDPTYPLDRVQSDLLRNGYANVEVRLNPGPLPDPWPNMLVWYEEMGCGWRRAAIASVRTESTIRLSPEEVYRGVSFYCEGSVSVPWHPNYVREVRSPSGAVLWRRE